MGQCTPIIVYILLGWIVTIVYYLIVRNDNEMNMHLRIWLVISLSWPVNLLLTVLNLFQGGEHHE